ncbi:MAG: TolC family protein [Flavobacteriales bacterium]|nr:TolC family protein [Flavobacteriales bacterium]
MKLKFLCILVFYGFYQGTTVSSYAQNNVHVLNLETVLKLSGANNLVIKEYIKKQELEMANAQRAKEWWLPDFYAGTTVHQLWGSAMNGDGDFFQSVNRQNFWAGLGVNASWDFGQGIFTKNAAQLKVQASVHETQAKKNTTILNTIHIYYDFLEAQLQYKAYSNLLKQAETITEQIKIQVDAGFQFESEFLIAQSNNNHLKVEMLQAKTAFSIWSSKLINFLNLSPTSSLVASDSILAPIRLNDTDSLMAFDSIHSIRPEIKSLHFHLQSIKEEKKTVTNALYIPELRLGTYGSMFGDVFSPLNPTGEVNAALIWRIPAGKIKNGGAAQQYDARIALKENEIDQIKSQINEEVLRAKNQLLISQEQINIANEGKEFALKALDQCILRQKVGTVRPFELLQVQEVFIKSQLDYLNAIIKFNKAQYALFVAVGNNL